MRKGDIYRELGICDCIGKGKERSCFHRMAKVLHIYSDVISAFVENHHGEVKKIDTKDLTRK
jgi:hypothetical protein